MLRIIIGKVQQMAVVIIKIFFFFKYFSHLTNKPLYLKVPQNSYGIACSANNQCNQTLNLVCPISSATNANCPSTSVANKCDCSNGQYFDSVLGCGEIQNLF